MSDEIQLVSKILILDNCSRCFSDIKKFCEQHGLIALKAYPVSLMHVLSSNLDLSAILLAEDYCESLEHTLELAQQIYTIRPELPIVLRKGMFTSEFDALPAAKQKLFCKTYTIEDMSPLQDVIDEYIFSLVYPNALVRGISEMTVDTLSQQFKHLKVSVETPYIVRDRIIFGEVSSLIPLESSWCRGYMMLQMEDDAAVEILKLDELWARGGEQLSSITFRAVSDILGEITNLTWGAFKTRFIADDDVGSRSTTEVPIVINHQQKYISFGSSNPQLCFKYTLTDESKGSFLHLHQRFIFNLYWSPEDFKEIQVSVDNFVESGELELF